MEHRDAGLGIGLELRRVIGAVAAEDRCGTDFGRESLRCLHVEIGGEVTDVGDDELEGTPVDTAACVDGLNAELGATLHLLSIARVGTRYGSDESDLDGIARGGATSATRARVLGG